MKTVSFSRITPALLGCVALALGLLICTAGSAQAIDLDKLTLENAKGTCKVTTMFGDSFYDVDDRNQATIGTSSGDQVTPKKAKSSKSSVLSVKTEEDSPYIKLTFKKPGKASLTYTWKGKKHKVKFVVYKYENPVKTFKIGSKDFASKLKKSAVATYGPYLGGKLVVKAKKNWKLVKIKKYGYKEGAIKNGSKIKKGDVWIVCATLKHKKTGVIQRASVVLATNYGG